MTDHFATVRLENGNAKAVVTRTTEKDGDTYADLFVFPCDASGYGARVLTDVLLTSGPDDDAGADLVHHAWQDDATPDAADTDDTDDAPPARNATSAEWHDWAVRTGRLTEDEAAPLSRADIQKRFAE